MYNKKIENVLYWSRVHPDAIVPTKENEDAAYDLYACIEGDIEISPHEIAMVPTGITNAYCDIQCAIIKERGSTGTIGLAVRCGVMDSGFRNEWKVVLQNTTTKPIIITNSVLKTTVTDYATFYPKSKAIAQVFFPKLAQFKKEETIKYEDLLKIESKRGLGMLGSSGK